MSDLQTRAAELYTALFGTWKGPKRASRMTGRADQANKYVDIPTYSFGRAHFDAHLDGRDTYAGTLGVLGTAWSGCKDYDDAGDVEIIAALATAAAKGITAAAFLLPGAPGEHSGGHLWTFYDRDYPESDIRAQLRTIPRSRKGEDYPSGNPVRLPFGYHKLKHTRGTLILQDGRRFRLDDPSQLIAGIEAFVALPRNGKPEPGQLGDARTSGATWGDAYKPAEWEDLPDGGPLWHSAYVAAVASRPGREPLAALLRGERAVIVKKDDTIDDSDSAQVAALCYNLMSGDVCEAQIRAMALYLKDTIRPGRALEHFKAHVDDELVKYRPKHYKPKPIQYTGAAHQPEPLPPAAHKPEPKSRARKDRPQPLAGAAGYLAWLRTQVDPQSDSVMLSQAQCAKRLGCCVRTIKRYEKALGPKKIERRVFAQRQAGCLFILIADVVTTSPADVVIADAETAQQNAENAQSATMQEEHTAPLVPSPPAPPPTLSALARHYCNVRLVDETTGAICRRSKKDFAALVAVDYPQYSEADAQSAYLVERQRQRDEVTPAQQRRRDEAAQRAMETPEQTQRRHRARDRARTKAFWDGERAKARALDNDPLLAALVGCASRMQAAERKRPGSPWAKRCAAIFAIYDDVRRQRGLSLTEAAPAPAGDRASRKQAKARMANVADVLNRPAQRSEHTAPSQLGFNDLQWLRPAEADQGDTGGACSSQLPASLVERLRDLKAKREACYATG